MTDHLESHILSKFKILKKIGSGAYGHVWKVIDSKDKKVKALKKNFDAFNNSTDAQRTYRQIMFLMQLKHPNIVKLQQVIRADNDLDIYLIFQHMDIDLFTLIRENILEEKHKKWILYQICKAMFYLHSAGLIHRDLKPSNILVNENCDAKLCDFGLVRSLDEQDEKDNILTEYIATRWYRAPQILVGSSYYTKAIDIWGLGCLIGQIFKGKPIFPGTSTINQMQRILSWTGLPKQNEIRSLKANGTEIFRQLSHVKRLNKKEFISNIPSQALQLMIRCLQFSPSKRITIDQIIKHPYLKEFYSKKDLITQKKKIKVSIDDNERLTLKQYRNIIYKQIKARDDIQQPQRRESIDKTLYRIRQASTKKHLVSMEAQKPKKISNLQTIQNNHKETKPSKKNSHQLLNSYNNQIPINKYNNSLSVPKPSNSSSLVRKKIHSINSNDFREKSMILDQKQSLKSKPLGVKHLKTMESEWNPIETKKAIDFRQEMRKTKNILTNTLLTKPKRSLYQMETKKVKRVVPSSKNEYFQDK